jgi:hypothetical protein
MEETLVSLSDPKLTAEEVLAGIASLRKSVIQNKKHLSNKTVTSYFHRKFVLCPDQVRANIASVLLSAEKDVSVEVATSPALDRLIRACGGSVVPESKNVLSEKFLPIVHGACLKFLRSGFHSVSCLFFSFVVATPDSRRCR